MPERRTTGKTTEGLESIQEVAEEWEYREQLHAVLTGIIKERSALLMRRTNFIITHVTNTGQKVQDVSQSTSWNVNI